MSATMHHADVLAWAATYTGPKYHAMLCDPPYHLTSINERYSSPDAKPCGYGTDGAFRRMSKGFMGKDWDGGDVAFRPETWAALAQHLHPGAFVFAFAGTRGYHRMACAIEDAGLIIHPAIGWNFSTGFPKATNISKLIDKRAGAERQVIGFKPTGADSPKNSNGTMRLSKNTYRNEDGVNGCDITAPATDLARQWAGHRYGGQVLKPAFEFICVAQVPYAGQPIDSITATGAGALNIDKSRIMPYSGGYQPHDEGAYVLRSAPSHRGADGTLHLSLEVVQDALRRIAFGLRFDSTADTSPAHGVGAQDDTLLAPAECGLLQNRLFPNGVWCGFDWSSVLDSQADCPACCGSCDVLLHQAQGAAQSSAPSLADALDGIYSHLCEPSHNHDSCTDRPSMHCRVLSLLDLLIGDNNHLFQCIIAYSAHPHKLDRPEYIPNGKNNVYGTNMGGGQYVPHDLGRWPANLLLTHDPRCNGACVADCAVAALGRQSGESTSTDRPRNNRVDAGTVRFCSAPDGIRVSNGFDDSGTAARYFHQSDWMLERLELQDSLIYSPKAARAEREAGLDPLQTALMRQLYGVEEDSDDFNIPLSDGEEISGGGGHSHDYQTAYQAKKTSRYNTHPTLKPISLCRHLATLLLPPDAYAPRRLLVPFAGAASEMVGALLAGWEEIDGVELDETHCRIGRARLAYWQQQRHRFDQGQPITIKAAPTTNQRTLFDE